MKINQNIYIFSEDTTPAAEPWPDCYRAGLCDLQRDHKTSFVSTVLDGLANSNPECVLYKHHRRSLPDISTVLSKYETEFLIADSEDISREVYQDIFQRYVSDLELSPEEIDLVSISTKGQSCNPNWVNFRTVILTASNFGEVCRRRDSTPAEKLIARLTGQSKKVQTRAMVYGLRAEVKARRRYMMAHHSKCPTGQVKLTLKGVSVNQMHPYLGASLDGLVNCKSCGTLPVEIKSPFKFR